MDLTSSPPVQQGGPPMLVFEKREVLVGPWRNLLDDPDYWHDDDIVIPRRHLRWYYAFWLLLGASLAFLATYFWPAGLFYELFFAAVLIGPFWEATHYGD